MIFLRSVLSLCLLIKCINAFIEFDHGKDYLFNITLENTQFTVNPDLRDEVIITGFMRVQKSNDNELLFRLEEFDVDEIITPEEKKNLEKPFKVQLDSNGDQESMSEAISDTKTPGINVDILKKYEVTRDFLRDFKEFKNLPENIINPIDLKLPFGLCHSNVTIVENEADKEIIATSKKSDCIISKKFKQRIYGYEGIKSTDVLPDDCLNGVKVTINRSDNQINVFETFMILHSDKYYEGARISNEVKRRFELEKVEDSTGNFLFEGNMVIFLT